MKQIIKILLLLLGFITFYACVKVDDDELPNTAKVELKEGKWTQITNLKVNKELLFEGRNNSRNRTEEQRCTDRFFFNLETGKQVPSNEAFTNKWDFSLKLYGERNFFINHIQPNKKWDCQWVGSQGEPMLCTLVAEDFEKVTEAPDPKEYQYNTLRLLNGKVVDKNNLTINYSFQYEGNYTQIGYYYEVIGITENGSPETSGNNAVQIIPNHTFILRTVSGKWAKVQIQSFYKDAPVEPTKESEPGYLTFRYYVQQDGSRNLDTR